MFSSGQKQCQRQKEAVGGLDSASPGCWGSYLPATGLRLPEANAYLQCKGCQYFSPVYLWGGGPVLQEWWPECSPSANVAQRALETPLPALFPFSDPRGTHLWEFIRDILLNPEKNPGLIKWEDRSEGVFRFLKSEAVAQLWGKKKNNSSMTYEKLSRAMRWAACCWGRLWNIHRPTGLRIYLTFRNDFSTAPVAFFDSLSQ